MLITSPLLMVKITQPFTPSRGIRQGGPISPYIFILAMEYLSKPIEDKSFGLPLNFVITFFLYPFFFLLMTFWSLAKQPLATFQFMMFYLPFVPLLECKLIQISLKSGSQKLFPPAISPVSKTSWTIYVQMILVTF